MNSTLTGPASIKTLLNQTFHMPGLTVLGMLIFLAVFVGVWGWVYRKGGREFYERASRLPLD